VSVDQFRRKYVKGLSREEAAHLTQLDKAQATIQEQKSISVDEKGGTTEKGDKTEKKDRHEQDPVFDGFKRADDERGVKDMASNPRDRKRKAVILLQRLIRGRAH